MNHVPYPSTSELPPLEVPLLCRSEQLHTYYNNEAEKNNTPDDSNESYILSLNPPREAFLSGVVQNPPDAELRNGRQNPNGTFEKEDWTTTFWHYPHQQGWIHAEKPSHWYHCSNKEAATRAQDWLYFQLLDNFLGLRIDVRIFTRPSTSSRETVIDSSILPQLLEEWGSRTRSAELGNLNAGDTFRLLTKVLQACNYLDELVEPSKSISFSIRVLVETLARAVWGLSNDNITEQWRIWKLGPTPLLADRMANAGWCRDQVDKLWYQYLPSTMYYLSSLPNRATFGGVTHQMCSTDHCTSTKVDPISYEPRHRDTCVLSSANDISCTMVSVNTALLSDIIRQDSFPLIEIQAQADGSTELKVHKYTRGLHYVAISHVWSGGLGNVNANSMRLCQLKYLHDLLHHIRKNGDDDLDRRHGSRKIDDGIDDIRVRLGFARKQRPLLLWIDTLCVPVGSKHTVAYTKTLRRMAQIYVTAQCALVLDPELQDIKHRKMQKEQVFAHISCCSWMSRCWTFQEACMSRIFVIQFKDGYFVVDQQYFDYQEKSGQLDKKTEAPDPAALSSPSHSILGDRSTSQVSLMQDTTHWFREMPVIQKIRNRDPRVLMSKLEDWKKFALAWNGLRHRSTTKAGDFHGILAVVVDLSAGEVLELHPDERLKAIYRSQTTLPLPLLYQACPRIMDERGHDSWAPSKITGDRLDLHSGCVTVEPDGLLIDPIHWSQPNKPQAILLASAPTSCRYLDVGISELQTRTTVELLVGRTSALLDTPSCSLCCIVDATLARNIPGVGTYAPGACLIIHSRKGPHYEATFFCPIRAFSSGNGQSWPDGSVSMDQEVKPEPPKVSAILIDWSRDSIHISSNLASWPSSLSHVSKRSSSTLILIRNASIWCQLSYNLIAQGPYVVGIGVCSAHRSNPTTGRLFWLLLSRWLAIMIEIIWEVVLLVLWDQRRAARWSDRLYGTFKKPRLNFLKNISQYPVVIAKILILVAALACFGSYFAYGHHYMKFFAIILFSDFGLSFAYISLLIYLIFRFAKGQYRPFRLEIFTDLPEDPDQWEDSTLQYWEEVETRANTDHRYLIARVAWRIVGYVKRKHQASEAIR